MLFDLVGNGLEISRAFFPRHPGPGAIVECETRGRECPLDVHWPAACAFGNDLLVERIQRFECSLVGCFYKFTINEQLIRLHSHLPLDDKDTTPV